MSFVIGRSLLFFGPCKAIKSLCVNWNDSNSAVATLHCMSFLKLKKCKIYFINITRQALQNAFIKLHLYGIKFLSQWKVKITGNRFKFTITTKNS